MDQVESTACVFCNNVGVGLSELKPVQSPLISSSIHSRRRKNVLFNLGNGYCTTDEEEAKDYILGREFPQILKLKGIKSNEEFSQECIGVNKMPNLNLSEIPHIVNYTDYQRKTRERGLFSAMNLTQSQKHYRTPENQHRETVNMIKKEVSEAEVFHGIDEYFQLKNESVIIFTNIEVNDEKEKDAVIVNLTRGYILLVEVKNFLTDRKYTNQKYSSIQKGVKQLNEAHQTLKRICNLKNEWMVIKMLFGMDKEPLLYICSQCHPFVATSKETKFSKLMETIINHSAIDIKKDFTFCDDFYKIIRELLPTRLRIASDVTDLFSSSMKSSILEGIKSNVKQAGRVENIAFWSNNQIDIVQNSLWLRRVLFVPHKTGYSTGKTLLMAHCAKQLSRRGEKVLWISTNSEILSHVSKILGFSPVKSIQHMNLEKCFQNEKNIELTMFPFDTPYDQKATAFENFLRTKTNYHIFIDEMAGKEENQDVYHRIIKWSKLHNQNKHLWIVCYQNVDEISDEQQLNEKFLLIDLKYPLRNTSKIVQFCQSKSRESTCRYAFEKYDHSRNLLHLECPTNLTEGFDPIEIRGITYKDGLEKALEVLKDLSDNQIHPTLFVFGNFSYMNCKKCYNMKLVNFHGYFGDLQFLSHIKEIYNKCGRPDQEIVENMWMPETRDNYHVKDWVNDLRGKDMFTKENMIHGLSHDVVVVFKDDNTQLFPTNVCLRACAILVVVTLPELAYDNLCFCGEPKEKTWVKKQKKKKKHNRL